MPRSIPTLAACGLALALASGCGAKSPGAKDPTTSGAEGGALASPKDEIAVAKVAVVDASGGSLSLGFSAMRGHPVLKRLGPVFRSMPQFKDLLRALTKDPVQDLSWLYMTGPTLDGSPNDAFVIRHEGEDRDLDAAIEAAVSRTAAPTDVALGMSGVRATKLRLDGAARILLRAQPQFVAVVAPSHALEAATQLVRARPVPPLEGKEALRATLYKPSRTWSEVPDGVTEARIRMSVKEDGGLDVRADGDCSGETSARAVSEALRQLVSRMDTMVVRMVTRDLPSSIQVDSSGSTVHVRIDASPDQVQATLGLLATAFGTSLNEPPKAAGK